MRKFLLPFASAISLYSTISFAAQETWLVKEGLDGEFQGIWTVTVGDGELRGSAQMYDRDGKLLTYFFSGNRIEGEYVVVRESPSDGIICNYWLKNTPQLSDDPLPLSAPSICQGKDQLWLASKLPELEQTGN